ncbi:MAG: tRNA preQ1(34) S-adenosylmethionine ribosyltransferase-isomerase QueA [Candidatus Cloacimonetes bacterium]|nr:tRNA preQ1(34) S-adenosylmethionine ribosyltransferase-isomerase QueA [Candidatus Cloacimonadota bacterium]
MNPYLLSSYQFELSRDRIAQTPLANRDSSRLLDFSNQVIRHSHFYDLEKILAKPCLFVRNVSRVRKARILAKRQSGGLIEALLLNPLPDGRWQALMRPAKRLRAGEIIHLPGSAMLEVIKKGEMGHFEIRLLGMSNQEDWIQQYGETPLPPYIGEKLEDSKRYQTVYAQETGACAAPTAGLHFTDEQIKKLESLGHKFCDVVLHVGIGTFRPVDTEDIRDFNIHHESIRIEKNAIKMLKEAKELQMPIVAVGTTSLRVLESVFLANGLSEAYSGTTNLYLMPGQKIHSVDYLLTNFHLPGSSLLILIAAFLGEADWKSLYEEAIRAEYRFFSFGDCMLLPNLS